MESMPKFEAPEEVAVEPETGPEETAEESEESVPAETSTTRSGERSFVLRVSGERSRHMAKALILTTVLGVGSWGIKSGLETVIERKEAREEAAYRAQRKEERFREYAAQSTASRERLFDEFKELETEPYAWELTQKAIEAEPWLGLAHYEKYRYFPGASERFRYAVAFCAEKDPLMLIRFAPAVRTLPEHKALLTKAVADAEAQRADLMFLKYGNNILDIPGVEEKIENTIAKTHKYDPAIILTLAKGFDRLPDAATHVAKSVSTLREREDYYMLVSRGDNYAGLSEAPAVLAEAAAARPDLALEFSKEYKAIPNASAVLERSVRTLLTREPELVLARARGFISEPYAEECVHSAARTAPLQALAYYGNYEDLSNARAIAYEAAQASVEHSPEEVLAASMYYDEHPGGEALTLRAAQLTVERNPIKGVELFSSYDSLPEEQYLPLIERAATACATRAPALLLEEASRLPRAPWMDRLIEAAAAREPEHVVKNYRYFRGRENADVLLHKALPIAAEVSPEAVLVFYRDAYGVDGTLPDDPRIVQAVEHAALANPNSALYMMKYLRPLLEQSTSPAAQKLLEIEDYRKAKDEASQRALPVELLLQDLADGKTTIEEAEKTVGDDAALFSALVRISRMPTPAAAMDINGELRERALPTIRTINMLHDERDAVRFKSLENATLEELYVYMVHGDEELYTSSFNGLFNRLLGRMKEQGVDGAQLLDSMGHSKFRTFVRMAASFNRLNEFLDTMQPQERSMLLERFVEGLDREHDMLGQAVTIADTFNTLTDPEVLRAVQTTTKREYERVQSEQQEDARRVYGLLASMFGDKAVVEEHWIREMSDRYKLGSVLEMSSEKLFNQEGADVQRYYFYNDDDGAGSFRGLMAQYRGAKGWRVEDAGSYVKIFSEEGARVVMYANKPDNEKGHEELDALFKEKQIVPAVVVHRGHSYHADKTIERVHTSARIVYMGSCGGYRSISTLLNMAPEASVIATKGTGTITVNEPLLHMMNEEIRTNKHISWPEFWEKATKRLGRNPQFNNYVPPHRNLGILFLKAYRSDVQ